MGGNLGWIGFMETNGRSNRLPEGIHIEAGDHWVSCSMRLGSRNEADTELDARLRTSRVRVDTIRRRCVFEKDGMHKDLYRSCHSLLLEASDSSWFAWRMNRGLARMQEESKRGRFLQTQMIRYRGAQLQLRRFATESPFTLWRKEEGELCNGEVKCSLYSETPGW